MWWLGWSEGLWVGKSQVYTPPVYKQLTQQAQVPPGVFNVLSCSRETTPSLVDILCYSELVRKLSFTGSTGVGKLLMEKCARTVKRVSMELGGNAPLIVFNSANIETAVRGTLAAKFRNTGQACISSNRWVTFIVCC